MHRFSFHTTACVLCCMGGLTLCARAGLLEDRTAIERIYHDHRLGTTKPFEQALPTATIQQLIHQEQRKEQVLRDGYGVEISPAMVTAELQRINRTTRAPEMLAEIKDALGNDPVRFAEAFVKPIIVERELRQHFNDDSSLHAAKRQQAEQARNILLTGGSLAGMSEVVWQLKPRPENKHPAPAAIPDTTKGTSQSSSYSNTSSARITQILAQPASTDPNLDTLFYFEDLHPELQRVLQAQLKKADDVSAVIEMPDRFLVFQATDKTETVLRANSLNIPKRNYNEWLNQYSGAKP